MGQIIRFKSKGLETTYYVEEDLSTLETAKDHIILHIRFVGFDSGAQLYGFNYMIIEDRFKNLAYIPIVPPGPMRLGEGDCYIAAFTIAWLNERVAYRLGPKLSIPRLECSSYFAIFNTSTRENLCSNPKETLENLFSN